MLYKKAMIKGDAVDRVGKSVMTIIVAFIAMVAAYISYKQIHEFEVLVQTSLIAVEITVLTILQKRIWKKCLCIPMLHFTFVFLVSYLNFVSVCESYGILIYCAFMGMLLIAAVVNMLRINGSNEKELRLGIIYSCLLVFILLDMCNALAGITSLSGGIEIITDFISRLAIFVAIILLYLPEQGFLNIRRITLIICTYLGLDLGLFTILNIVAKFIAANYVSYILIGLISSSLAMPVTLVLCGRNSKVHPNIENDEYDYTRREKLLKAIGWNISESEQFNRRKLLEDAFGRDFVKEYTGRLYGEMDCMKDIGKIQNKLAEIKTVLEELDAGDVVRMSPKIAKVESEGAELLGKLSIAYNFDTGISSCPIELLRSGCESGGNDNRE